MTPADRFKVAAIRMRHKVAHVEGSGAETFHAAALEDVGALLAILDHIEAQEHEAKIGSLQAELDHAEDERIRVGERLERFERHTRNKVDQAAAKLKEVFE